MIIYRRHIHYGLIGSDYVTRSLDVLAQLNGYQIDLEEVGLELPSSVNLYMIFMMLYLQNYKNFMCVLAMILINTKMYYLEK